MVEASLTSIGLKPLQKQRKREHTSKAPSPHRGIISPAKSSIIANHTVVKTNHGLLMEVDVILHVDYILSIYTNKGDSPPDLP